MNAIVRNIMGRLERWPEEDQEELAQVALAIELRREGPWRASADELQAIDEALDAVDRGDIETSAKIEELLAKHRNA